MPCEMLGVPSMRIRQTSSTVTLLLTWVALLATSVALGYAWRRSVSDSAQQIERLQQEVEELRQALAQHRELLRDQTLKSTRRSPDEFLALFPAKFPAGNYQPAEQAFEDCWFTSSDGLRLHAWYLPHPQPKAAILHLHGNAGNLSHRAHVAEYLQRTLQASVLLLDYRGYGRSEGVPTMDGILKDARAARTYLASRESIADSGVVLLGESLGGAVAVDLAADGARGLVLESTFFSLRDVAGVHYPRFLVNMVVADKLNSAVKIRDYHGPLLQVHGTADQTVPLASAEKLFAAANEPKTFIKLSGHDHNVPLPQSYYQALLQFIDALPKLPKK